MKKESPYHIESLQRGLQVLTLFNRERPALSLTEIVEATGIKKSTAFRIVNTLNSTGYLERDPDTRQYRPGLKVLQLGFTAISSLELRQVARPHLVNLAEMSGETASLSVLDGLEVVYVDRIRGRDIIVGVVLGVGSRIPAHCASMGKVLLANLPADELARRLDGATLSPCTPHSLVDKDQLRAELEQIRSQGFAVNDEELEIGLRAVAAPIWDQDNQVVAVINVSGSVRTISAERLENELTPAVRDTARLISQSIGFSSYGL
ncbi:MAG: IclR family transcriptional regulator [Chloroflexota bacterium]|nr:MAG: IclR family transcriptional regulator [Chloroflexota bacterium]